MKNIFKMMGIALLACSMIMVSCKKDDDNNESGQGGQGGGGTDQATLTITWDGEAQTIGYTDAYPSGSVQNAYWLDAAKGLNGNDYVWPEFVIGFYNGQDGFYEASGYVFLVPSEETPGTYDTVPGSYYFGTEVYETGGLVVDEDSVTGEQTVMGEYQVYPLGGYKTTPVAFTFDATKLTATGSATLALFNYESYATAIVGYRTGVLTPEEAAASIVWKDLTVAMTNYPFSATK